MAFEHAQVIEVNAVIVMGMFFAVAGQSAFQNYPGVCGESGFVL